MGLFSSWLECFEPLPDDAVKRINGALNAPPSPEVWADGTFDRRKDFNGRAAVVSALELEERRIVLAAGLEIEDLQRRLDAALAERDAHAAEVRRLRDERDFVAGKLAECLRLLDALGKSQEALCTALRGDFR